MGDDDEIVDIDSEGPDLGDQSPSVADPSGPPEPTIGLGRTLDLSEILGENCLQKLQEAVEEREARQGESEGEDG
jgi:hypothetical protein